MPEKKAAIGEHQHLELVGVRAVGVDRRRRVGEGPQEPAHATPPDEHHRGQADHRDGQDHVVVADVGVGVEPAEAGPGRADGERPAEHEHRRVDEPLDHQPEAERGDGQVDAGEPDGRDGQQRPDRDGHEPAGQHGQRPGEAFPDEPGGGGRTDGGEGDVAQRRLARRPHQQAQRGEQDHVGHAGDVDRQPGADDVRDDQCDTESDRGGNRLDRRAEGHRRQWAADHLRAPLHQLAGGGDEQRHEQHDERKVGGEALDGARDVHLTEDLGDDRGSQPEPEPADVGERQAGERPHRRRPEGEEDQQGEEPGVERQRGSEQDP